MSTFADSLVSQLNAPVSAPAAETPATPASTPETPTPASAPESPASPTAPTPAETPANPEIPAASEEEFEWPDENAPQPADAAKPEGTPETPAQPEASTDDPNNWKADEIEKLLPQQVIDKLLTTQKGRNIYQSYKMLREAEQVLGFRPTVQQLTEMHQDANDLQIMAHEFQNAHMNPQYGQNWIRQWFQVQQDGRPAPHSMAVAQQLAQTLDTHSPDLYRATALPFVQNYIEERYRAANAETDPEQRVVLFNVARILEADIKGQAREIPESVWKGGQPMQPQADPRETEINQKLQRIENFEKGQQAAAQNAFVARLNGDIRSAVTKDISFALKPLEEMYKGADGKPNRAYTALQNQFHNEVVQRVNQNPAQLRTYVIARDRARATGQPADIQNAARAWAAAARPIIKQLRSEYLQDALTRKVTESNQRHAVLQEASQKRGSTSIGQPTEKNAQPKVVAQPGEGFQDVLRRTLANVTQGAA